MNICIFPGTFNPIHEAHLKMANFALQKYKFDKIIFIPAYIPPHKEINSNLAEHRLHMVKLATASNPKFAVSDIEYKSENKSYTLITVKKIKEQYNITDKINMLIGTDAFAKIKTWYKVDELKNLVHFIVFDRGIEINPEEYMDFDFEFAGMEFFDISSTNLRLGINEDKTNKEVREYIRRNGLYGN